MQPPGLGVQTTAAIAPAASTPTALPCTCYTVPISASPKEVELG